MLIEQFAGESVLTYFADDFCLQIDRDTGLWIGLEFEGEILLEGGADFTFSLDGWKMEQRRFVSSEQVGNCVILLYELTEEDGRTCQARQTLDFSPNRMERGLTLRRDESGSREQLLSVTLMCEGLRAGDQSETLVSMPMTRSQPALPLEMIAGRTAGFEKNGTGYAFDPTGLDISLAVAMLARKDGSLHLGILPIPNECPVKVRLHGKAGRLFLSHEFACESWLEGGVPLKAVRQVFQISRQDWQTAARAVGDCWLDYNYQPPKNRSTWAKEAIILEIDLTFFGGLQKLITKLDEIRDLGFNTLYLLPWHPGHWNGYGTYRYDQINPSYGTFKDLRHLCDEARQRGLRVLFDLLVNVAGEDSPYPADHPDWFYRDEAGTILRHPTWNSWCLDPASPGFRRALIEYSVRCCTEWGADGFRVDAAAYRGGNWNNLPGLQPHQHAHAIFTLLHDIRDAIREHHPEAICLAECFGPGQVPISDTVAYQWVAWLDWVNESLLSGALSGTSLGRLLGEHFLAMPRDTWLLGYTHTHDTVAFEHRELDGPAVDALLATLTFLCAGTMIFGGGWEMRRRPGSETEVNQLRQLFTAKSKLGGISCHELYFVEDSDPNLLIVERPSKLGRVRVISNFGSVEKSIPLEGQLIYSRLGSASGQLAPFDTIVVTL